MKPAQAAPLTALTIVLAGCGGGEPSTPGSSAGAGLIAGSLTTHAELPAHLASPAGACDGGSGSGAGSSSRNAGSTCSASDRR